MMATPQELRIGRLISSHLSWLMFLVCVVAVRGWHLRLVPSVNYGMNVATATDAKFLWEHGLENSPLLFPLLPTVPLVIGSAATGLPPGLLLSGYVLLACVLHAAAFWGWLASLPLPRQLRYFSGAAFLFLPLHNGYRGLFHVQSILAETMFLVIAAWFQRRSAGRSVWSTAGVMFLAACLPWTRSEYLLFVPLYLLIVSLADLRTGTAHGIRRRWQPAGIILAGLLIGTLTAMQFRFHYVQEFALVPGDYTCWTFLDGMPPQWLAEQDNSEYARRMAGIARFGHPSLYGDSLPKMMLAHPLLTLQKFLLNVPRWCWELCRTDQTLPWPAALLALCGLLQLLRWPWRSQRIRLAIRIVSLIVITVPIIAIMLYPNYIRTAFDALCSLMSLGAIFFARLVHKVIRAVPTRWCFWGLAIALCDGMEYLYFRSGAHHPDLPVYAKLARQIDAAIDRPSDSVLLDPYEGAIDAASHTAFQNQWAVRQHELKFGKDRVQAPQPIPVPKLFETVLDQRTAAVAVWADVNLLPQFDERLESWRARGFQAEVIHRVDGSPGPSWKLAICRPINPATDLSR